MSLPLNCCARFVQLEVRIAEIVADVAIRGVFHAGEPVVADRLVEVAALRQSVSQVVVDLVRLLRCGKRAAVAAHRFLEVPDLHPGIAGVVPGLEQLRLDLERTGVAFDRLFVAAEPCELVPQVVPGFDHRGPSRDRLPIRFGGARMVSLQIAEVPEVEPDLGRGLARGDRAPVILDPRGPIAKLLHRSREAEPDPGPLRIELNGLPPHPERSFGLPLGEQILPLGQHHCRPITVPSVAGLRPEATSPQVVMVVLEAPLGGSLFSIVHSARSDRLRSFKCWRRSSLFRSVSSPR